MLCQGPGLRCEEGAGDNVSVNGVASNIDANVTRRPDEASQQVFGTKVDKCPAIGQRCMNSDRESREEKSEVTQWSTLELGTHEQTMNSMFLSGCISGISREWSFP